MANFGMNNSRSFGSCSNANEFSFACSSSVNMINAGAAFAVSVFVLISLILVSVISVALIPVRVIIILSLILICLLIAGYEMMRPDTVRVY